MPPLNTPISLELLSAFEAEPSLQELPPLLLKTSRGDGKLNVTGSELKDLERLELLLAGKVERPGRMVKGERPVKQPVRDVLSPTVVAALERLNASGDDAIRLLKLVNNDRTAIAEKKKKIEKAQKAEEAEARKVKREKEKKKEQKKRKAEEAEEAGERERKRRKDEEGEDGEGEEV